ncbi:TerB family tellurite resistance protein [Fluviicola sp.]|uniref:TerB family tellurite resistance protein n=1 Tax=Fluviicola sp. TaxID=1917219 RepID=UPI0031E1EC1C
MGLFDKLFNSNSSASTVSYSPKNEQEAWVAIMYSCMATDGDVSEIEIDKLLNFLVFKTMFNGHNVVEDLYKPAMLAQKQIGSKEVIDSSVSLIKDESKPTLFALVMEILLADGVLGSDEQEIAEYLTNALNLNPETAQKIVEVMLIKNQGNFVVVG